MKLKLYYLVALVINSLSFISGTDSSYLMVSLVMINFVVMVELTYELGKKINSSFGLPQEFVLNNISGLIFLSLITFFLLSFGAPARVIFPGALIIFCLMSLCLPRLKSADFFRSLVQEFSQNGWPLNTILLFFFALAWIPNSYHDSLNYHLLGPSFWSQNYLADSIKNFLQIVHCSYFEYIYIWGFSFFKTSFTSKIFSQIFCQQLHLFYGAVLCSFLLRNILNKMEVGNKNLISVVMLLIFSRLSLGNLIITAKTDWAIITVGLVIVNFYFFQKRELDFRLSAFIGVLAGYAICLKYSYLIWICLWLTLAIVQKRISFKNLIFLGLALVLTFLPLLVRNFLWTNNPFFPLFSSIFKSDDLGPSWLNGFSQFGQIHLGGIEWVNKVLDKIVAKNFVNYLIFLSPIYFFLKKKKDLLWLWLICFFSLVILFILSPVEITETRHIAVAIVMLQLLNCYVFFDFIQRFKNKMIPTIVVTGLVAVCSIIPYFQAIPQHQIIQAQHQQFLKLGFNSYVKKHLGHSILDYLQSEHEGKTIFVISDIPMYYFVDYHCRKIWDWSELDRALYQSKNFLDLLDIFVKFEGTHLLIDNYYFDRFYNPVVYSKIMESAKNYPKAVVFHQNETYLLDLNVLKAEIEKESKL